MGAENRSGKRKLQLRAGAGFCVLKGSGYEISQGVSSGIRYFNFYDTV